MKHLLQFNWLWLCRISNTATACVCVSATHPTPTSWSASLSRKTGWSWPWTPVVGGLWWSHWAGSWHPQSGLKRWQPTDPRRWWRRRREQQTSWRGFAGSDLSEDKRMEDILIYLLICLRISVINHWWLKMKMRLIISIERTILRFLHITFISFIHSIHIVNWATGKKTILFPA